MLMHWYCTLNVARPDPSDLMRPCILLHVKEQSLLGAVIVRKYHASFKPKGRPSHLAQNCHILDCKNVPNCWNNCSRHLQTTSPLRITVPRASCLIVRGMLLRVGTQPAPHEGTLDMLTSVVTFCLMLSSSRGPNILGSTSTCFVRSTR